MKVILCDICDTEVNSNRLKVTCKKYLFKQSLNKEKVQRSNLDVHRDCWFEVLQTVARRKSDARGTE